VNHVNRELWGTAAAYEPEPQPVNHVNRESRGAAAACEPWDQGE